MSGDRPSQHIAIARSLLTLMRAALRLRDYLRRPLITLGNSAAASIR